MPSRHLARSAWSSLSLACFGILASCARESAGTATIHDITLPTTPSGEVPISFVLNDDTEDATDVDFEVSLDGGETWQKGTLVGGDRLEDLRGGVLGKLHEFVWDSVADIGFRTKQDILLSLRTKGALSRKLRQLGSIENLPHAADRVTSYMIHFGAWDQDKIRVAKEHDLVILSPCEATTTREVIAAIQGGRDAKDPRDDVIVLGYLNIGEDDRTIGVDDDALLRDPRFAGDSSGPRVDPRGPGPDGRPLTSIDPRGMASTSGGYASFYLDDNSVEALGRGDGRPDRNRVTGACYVNAGDPAWYDVLSKMVCDSDDARAGILEILTTKHGRGFGCDGVFLDNVDTCAPNAWTTPKDEDHATFEWTAPGMAAFMARLRKDFPKHVIAQNRGLFFMDPGQRHYAYSTRASIDFLKVESYRLDRATDRDFDTFYFADNKYNFVPKLQAEAYRRDGFQVLSLGYASGPTIDAATLVGESERGKDTLLVDIVEAQQLAGFRHYLTDLSGSLVNDFVRKHAKYSDNDAPRWTSTYNDNVLPYPSRPIAATPRVGVQELVGGSANLTLRWDVALDLHPVRYVLYLDDKPLRFSKDGKVQGVKPRALDTRVGQGYARGTAPGVYPFEATITGLDRRRVYYACVRAMDSMRNEDDNRVVLAARTQ